MQVCWFLFVCLYVSSLGRLAWSYIFPVNMKFHAKFCSISLRCEHRGRNVWTFYWPSTSFFSPRLSSPCSTLTCDRKLFFSIPKVFASFATEYLLVTVHRTEDVMKQEVNKNSKATPGKDKEWVRAAVAEAGQHPQCTLVAGMRGKYTIYDSQ